MCDRLCSPNLWRILALCAGLIFLSSCSAEAKKPSPYSQFANHAREVIAEKPAYVWGGSESVAKGLDCSGLIFKIARDLGRDVRRTTAEKMFQGECGWDGVDVACAPDAVTGTLVWWNLKEKRPHGHIGIVFRNPDQVGHASQSRGHAVIEEWIGWAKEKISGLKNITALR